MEELLDIKIRHVLPTRMRSCGSTKDPCYKESVSQISQDAGSNYQNIPTCRSRLKLQSSWIA